jgi:hypothetical protein
MRTDEELIAPGVPCLPDPTNTEYEWVHWIPLDRFKVVIEAEIRHSLRTCRGKQVGSELLEQIPKKIPRKLACTRGIEGFGLHAYRRLAWWRVFAMGLLFNAPGVIMLILKLKENPDDLVTAFAVLVTTMAIFTGYFAIAAYFGVEDQGT